MLKAKKPRKPSNPWVQVVFSADCDEDGNCPKCGTDYSECSCPGPTQDGYEYKTGKTNGLLYARKVKGATP